MPEHNVSEFVKSLESLEDTLIVSTNLRSYYYDVVLKTITSEAEVSGAYINRIMSICIHDLKENSSLLPIITKTIHEIMEKVKTLPGSFNDYLKPALEVIDLLKTTEIDCEVLVLALDILQVFSDETLLAVAENHFEEAIAVFQLYHDEAIPVSLQYRTIKFLHRLLKILPQFKVEKLLTYHLDLWFLIVIPNITNSTATPESWMDVEILIETLELITKGLTHINYHNNVGWQVVLESIYNPNKYPNILQTLLVNGTTPVVWHRLWMVLVKLLKNQITMIRNNKGSPINSMLPVVEMAYKMDTNNRCRAFQCWKSLIEIFSNEKNETCVDRRIKLLVIPLRSNNARIKEIATVKHETWWYLIKQFETVSYKLHDSVIIPFLHFCFGKHDCKSKNVPAVIPGLMSDSLKDLSLQTFTELAGHSSSCKCNITVLKLSEWILNSNLLVSYWNDWFYALKMAIVIHCGSDELSSSYLSCIWTSFLKVVADMPSNNVRKDLFNELLTLILELEKELTNAKLYKVTFEVMKPPLFKDLALSQLFRTRESVTGDITTAFLNILNLEFSHKYFESCDTSMKNHSLEYLTDFIANQPSYLEIIEKVLGKMASPNFLSLWNILADALIAQQSIVTNVDVINKMLQWVIKSMDIMKKAGKYTRQLWGKLYCKYYSQNLCKNIFKVLQNYKMFAVMDHSGLAFIFTAVAFIFNQSWNLPSEADYEFVQSVFGKLSTNYEDVEEHITVIMDPIVAMCSRKILIQNYDKNIDHILLTLKVLLELMMKFLNERPDDKLLHHYLKSIITSIELLLKNHKNLDFVGDVSEMLLEQNSRISQSPVNETIFSFLKEATKQMSPEQPLYKKIHEYIRKGKITKVFITPNSKLVKTKSKETNILKTFIENGEEFVVVQSNWKFNPKKLTENQKEKFKRKREDIPALYQDLSQSQDDSKIAAWKPDSQDTSISSSKSNSKTGNETVPSMLKNAVGAEIVPKIIENISETDIINSENTNIKTKPSSPAIPKKEKKVQRMALKDRVFKNVRNLMEKSGFQNKEDNTVYLNVTLGNLTPVTPKSDAKVNEVLINSAPPKIVNDRPSRVKRKPNKFKDSQMSLIKRKRRNSAHSDSQSGYDSSDNVKNENALALVKDVVKNGAKENAAKSDSVDSKLCENDNEKYIGDLNDKKNQLEKSKTNINSPQEDKEIVTAMLINNDEDVNINVTDKKSTKEDILIMTQSFNNSKTGTEKPKTPRITKNLVINTVEGHPFLHQPFEKRTPRRCVVNSIASAKKKNTPKFTNKSPKDVESPNNVIFEDSKEKSSKKNTHKNADKTQKKDVEILNTVTVDDLELKASKIKNASMNTNKTPEIVVENTKIVIVEDSQEKATKKKSGPRNTDITQKKMVAENSNRSIVEDIQENTLTHKNILNHADKMSKGHEDKIQKKDVVILNTVMVDDLEMKGSKNKTAPKNTNKTHEDVVKNSNIIVIVEDSQEKATKNKNSQTNTDRTPKKIVTENSNSTKFEDLRGKTSKQKNVLKNADEMPDGDLDNANSVEDFQNSYSFNTMSEDIIESSQDSTITTISVKSSKPKKYPVVKNDQVKNKKVSPAKNILDGIEQRSDNAVPVVVVTDVLAFSPLKNVPEANSDQAKVVVADKLKTPSPNTKILEKDAKKTNSEIVVIDLLDDKNKTPSPNKTNSKKKSEQMNPLVVVTDMFFVKEKTPSPKKIGSKDPVIIVEDLFMSKKWPLMLPTKGKNSNHIDKIVGMKELHKPPVARESSSITVMANSSTKEDTILAQNKTAISETEDSTENMDTEPTSSSDVIVVENDIQQPIIVESEITYISTESQELAAADTLPLHPNFPHEDTTFELNKSNVKNTKNDIELTTITSKNKDKQARLTLRLSDISASECEAAGLSSPFKDDELRQQDFLNNTLEISPIKSLTPIENKTNTPPKTNTDYVLIKLSSPVNSNGEPIEKCNSPEIFTYDKTSPDNRDQSPPRVEVPVTNTSPSTSLSLKKNRSQVRPTGRAAQMLGLCVPDRLQNIINTEIPIESEKLKKTSFLNTPARRNLRKLYNTNDNCDSSDENEDNENFLRFKRLVPTCESSPSGPILKRKLADIDEANVSPASKRKRVSFHDPPVSTTVSVQKYIDPCGVRSPQNSALKKLERQNRVQTNMKSQKRLDNVFKLNTVLTKAVESFTDVNFVSSDDTQISSLEQTQAAEIVKTSDLNDFDPICPDLVDCTDPIANIASELSSPSMRDLLVKELKGSIDTIGDLAKLTELEINRLCIKSPKVQITKKVLDDYLINLRKDDEKKEIMDIDIVVQTPIAKTQTATEEVETQTATFITTKEIQMQTDKVIVNNAENQTDKVNLNHVETQTVRINLKNFETQTDDSGFKSTKDMIKALAAERTDFIEMLSENLDETEKATIADSLPFEKQLHMLLEKTPDHSSTLVLNRVLENQHNLNTSNIGNHKKELTFLQECMLNRFKSKDLILFCSKLLKNLHDSS